jgi:hypothetical protein
MTDERRLRRIDPFLLVTAGRFLLSRVVASFALLLVDVAVGLFSLATVGLVAVVGTLSYVRTTGANPDVRVEIR